MVRLNPAISATLVVRADVISLSYFVLLNMASEAHIGGDFQVLKPLIDFKGAVLDLDGTLLDAEPLYFEAYKYAANSYV